MVAVWCGNLHAKADPKPQPLLSALPLSPHLLQFHSVWVPFPPLTENSGMGEVLHS